MSRAFIINVILALNIICHALCSDVDTDQRVLSRRKRFLIFPTGASFSVAVCSTVGGEYLQQNVKVFQTVNP